MSASSWARVAPFFALITVSREGPPQACLNRSTRRRKEKMLIIPHNVADHASSLALLSFIDIRRTIGIRIQMTRAALVSRGLQPTLGVDRSPLHAL